MPIVVEPTIRLEETLKERDKIKVARAGEYALTFSSIHYNGFEILCKAETIDINGPELRLRPLGIRVRKGDFFDCKEGYYKPPISQEELESLLLDSLDGSNCELVSQVNIISTDQMVMSFEGWSDQRMKEVFRTVSEKVSDIGVQKGRALDLACGIGELMSIISSNYPQLDCYGIDLDQKGVQLARERVGQDRVFCGDAANIGSVFNGTYFDLITATGLITTEVIHAKEAATAIVREAYRRLKEGGRLILSDFAPVLTDKKTLESIGFRVLQTCIPGNFFGYNQPKQLYIGEK